MLSTLLLLTLATAASPSTDGAVPRSTDPRVTIELFAQQPEIVTPTGIAIDHAGRVLVVECHTHFRPPDYAGPPADRIRAFVDTDADGRADQVTNFYEGGTATMNLAVYEDDSVFVATRMEIHRLFDRDHDGQADERKLIAKLETKGDYPHNGLSGFAFDALGNVYFGMGENLGADYALVGSDGARLTGGGEGGSIYRCRADGAGLVRIATGFWNPFHLCCDAFDRLYAVDNDPDSRPPCRLLHIVTGGDYGYRFRNGRKGIHPFTAWNGELPGTLPMAAGTGEAPSGVLAYESDMLPKEYVGALLSTSWGDHRIDCFRLEPRGASFRAVAEPLITGDENFRPVGIALAADGSLFVSDWVDKSYELHGKGAIWRIRATAATKPVRPVDPQQAVLSAHRPLRQQAVRELVAQAQRSATEGGAARPLLLATATGAGDVKVRADALLGLARLGDAQSSARRIASGNDPANLRALAVRLVDDAALLSQLAEKDNSAEVRAAALRRLTSPAAHPLLVANLADRDPFIAQAAEAALAQITYVAERLKLASSESSVVRFAAIRLLRQSTDPAAQAPIARLLADEDAAVRFATVQWIAEANLQQYRDQITAGLTTGATTRALFEAYLAALERLSGVRREVGNEWSGDQYVLALIQNPATTPAVRARALRALRPDRPDVTVALLKTLLEKQDLATRLEAVRTLRELKTPESTTLIEQIVNDADGEELLRAEALVGLTPDSPERRQMLLQIAAQESETLRREALRSLRGIPLTEPEKAALRGIAPREPDKELVGRLMGNQVAARPEPTDITAWAAFAKGGDAQAGERVFFHPSGPACYRCHQVDGRGGTIGPELAVTTQNLTPARLLESLLTPSKEIAPQFASWIVIRQDGTTFTGVMLPEKPDGTRQFGTTEGRIVEIPAEEKAEVRPLKTSVMPENLHAQMTVAELADLLAFLQAQRDTAGRP